MFWGCFAASGTGCLEYVWGTMESQDYKGSKMCCPVSQSQSWVLQKDNDPIHTAKNKTLDYSEVAVYEP